MSVAHQIISQNQIHASFGCGWRPRYELLRNARLFHFGYPPLMRLMFENHGAQLAELYRRARETGVTTS